eukprot:TRINITY_DN18994_c0_g1_i1.p1 TRINITY_DN18994_c0_g1~~TRINITY_DN18994_c0_g1_i1.p1  ORF type:complete len:402 (-),score=85.48 TRINITY_DN18994_c0_g1_i1:155-1360(-)
MAHQQEEFVAQPCLNSEDRKMKKGCVSCGRTHALSYCARCHQERYCSRACQAHHWATHRLVCTPFRPKTAESNDSGEKICVTVYSPLTGQTICELSDVSPSSSIADVRELVSSSTEISVEEQRFVFRGGWVQGATVLKGLAEGVANLRLGMVRLTSDRVDQLHKAAAGHPLSELCETPTDDRELLTAAAAFSGAALADATPELQRDEEFVLEVVHHHGAALEFAAPELQMDEAFMAKAVAANSHALRFAPDEIRMDRDLLLDLVEQTASALYSVPDSFLEDEDFVIEAIHRNRGCFRYASQSMLGNARVAMFVAEHCPQEFRYVEEELISDPNFMLEVLHVNSLLMRYAHKDLKGDREFVFEALRLPKVKLVMLKYLDFSRDPTLMQDVEAFIIDMYEHRN